jgi:hypothetical protein
VLLADAVQELVRAEEQAGAVDGRAGVEEAPVAKIVHGKLLEAGPRREHEGSAVPSQVIQSPVGQQRGRVDLSGSFETLFVDHVPTVGLGTVRDAQLLVHPIEMHVR